MQYIYHSFTIYNTYLESVQPWSYGFKHETIVLIFFKYRNTVHNIWKTFYTDSSNSHGIFDCLWWVINEKTVVWIWAQEQQLGTENITRKRKIANVGEAGNKDPSSCHISVLWSLLKKPKCKLTWHINKEYTVNVVFFPFLTFFEQQLETKVTVTQCWKLNPEALEIYWSIESNNTHISL